MQRFYIGSTAGSRSLFADARVVRCARPVVAPFAPVRQGSCTFLSFLLSLFFLSFFCEYPAPKSMDSCNVARICLLKLPVPKESPSVSSHAHTRPLFIIFFIFFSLFFRLPFPSPYLFVHSLSVGGSVSLSPPRCSERERERACGACAGNNY